jgi:hypothetical protein
VAQFWLEAPTYTLQADPASPIEISWVDGLPRDDISRTDVSVSIDGGVSWEDVGSVDAATRDALTWSPDAALSTSALRLRVRAVDAGGVELAVDESIFNLGLGRPARGTETGVPDATVPTVAVVAPNGGETVAAREPLRIRWEADDDTGLASQLVEVSEDGGAKWTSLGEVPATARGLDWAPPAKTTDALVVRVTVRDHAGNGASDVSDGAARVRARPSVTTVSLKPKGTELLLRVKGTGFEAGATVVLNGEPLTTSVVVNGAGSSIKTRGDAAALHLRPAGETNTVVVVVGGLASAEGSVQSP